MFLFEKYMLYADISIGRIELFIILLQINNQKFTYGCAALKESFTRFP